MIAWKKICWSCPMGGQGTLNLQKFNKALLGKWWWKISSNPNSWWSKIINANYSTRSPHGVLFQNPPRKKFFFWVGVTSTLPPFQSCISKSVRSGNNTFFQFDRWIEGRTIKDFWPTLFNDCIYPWISLRQFFQTLNILQVLFHNAKIEDLTPLLNIIPDCFNDQEHFNTRSLEKSGTFSVKSFYNFLIDGGMHSPLYSHFWKIHYPSKITLLCQLVWDDKILTLSNLFKKGCNQNTTNTCVLCHKVSKTVEHPFIECEYLELIWSFFNQLLELQLLTLLVTRIWTSWLPSLNSNQRTLWDLISRAIVWNIWLE